VARFGLAAEHVVCLGALARSDGAFEVRSAAIVGGPFGLHPGSSGLRQSGSRLA
jgi:hypothetical protein